MLGDAQEGVQTVQEVARNYIVLLHGATIIMWIILCLSVT